MPEDETSLIAAIMDPKSASALDPKLKEVYDRVMGTAVGSNKPQSNPVSAPALPPLPPQTNGMSSPMNTPSPASPTSAPLNGNNLNSMQGMATPQPSNGNLVGRSNPSSPLQQNNPSQSQSSPLKPTVDYASIAAKYATPLPTLNSVSNPAPRQPVVTPSTTTYGVINNAGTKPAEKKEKKENSGGGMKKILLIVGLPIALFAYTAIWIVVFHVDIMALLPL